MLCFRIDIVGATSCYVGGPAAPKSGPWVAISHGNILGSRMVSEGPVGCYPNYDDNQLQVTIGLFEGVIASTYMFRVRIIMRRPVFGHTSFIPRLEHVWRVCS